MKWTTRVRKFFRDNFFSGLLLVVPLAGSLYVLVVLSRWVYRKVVVYPLVPLWALDLLYQVLPNWTERWVTKGIHLLEFGVVLLALMALTSLIGLITKLRLVRWGLGIGERIVKKIPLIGIIYSGLKQLLQAIVSTKESFTQVVMVQFPRPGFWSIGFLSKEVNPLFTEQIETKKLYAVFVPTTPNPTTGFFMMVPEEDVKMIALSVEDAFKIIMSGGFAQPEITKEISAAAALK